MLFLDLRGMAFILGLKNHFIFNFCLNNHSKSQSLKTEKKIICKFFIETKSELFLPKLFDDNTKNKMIMIANPIIKFMIHHITMSCPKSRIRKK